MTPSPSLVSGAGSQDPRYSLSSKPADRDIASLTVVQDVRLDDFVLVQGKVFDTVLYIDNPTLKDVKVTLPSGNIYKSFKGAAPLTTTGKTVKLYAVWKKK